MSETKWTKGPWLAATKPSSVVGWPVVAPADMGRSICSVTVHDDAEANARLIAAAPDLAEALADMLGAHPPISKRIGFKGSPARRAQEDQEAAIAKARAALARAKGAS